MNFVASISFLDSLNQMSLVKLLFPFINLRFSPIQQLSYRLNQFPLPSPLLLPFLPKPLHHNGMAVVRLILGIVPTDSIAVAVSGDLCLSSCINLPPCSNTFSPSFSPVFSSALVKTRVEIAPALSDTGSSLFLGCLIFSLYGRLNR